MVDPHRKGDDYGAPSCLPRGRNREVRRLFEAVGGRVNQLIRLRYGPVELPGDLPAGRWQELAAARVMELLKD